MGLDTGKDRTGMVNPRVETPRGPWYIRYGDPTRYLNDDPPCKPHADCGSTQGNGAFPLAGVAEYPAPPGPNPNPPSSWNLIFSSHLPPYRRPGHGSAEVVFVHFVGLAKKTKTSTRGGRAGVEGTSGICDNPSWHSLWQPLLALPCTPLEDLYRPPHVDRGYVRASIEAGSRAMSAKTRFVVGEAFWEMIRGVVTNSEFVTTALGTAVHPSGGSISVTTCRPRLCEGLTGSWEPCDDSLAGFVVGKAFERWT